MCEGCDELIIIATHDTTREKHEVLLLIRSLWLRNIAAFISPPLSNMPALHNGYHAT